MRKLNQPSLALGVIFDACKVLCHDTALQTRLAGVRATVETETSRYDEHATRSRLCEIQRATDIPPDVTGDEMRALYSRMRDREPTRGLFYDVILASAPNRTCPYCAHRTVSTLDHFLPKTHFPIFSITPSNLVPACKDCNHGKLSDATTDPNTQYLHPYFDRLPDGIWLTAEVVEGDPAAFRFHAHPPDADGWTAELQSRVRYQFSELALANLYTSHAGKRLSEIRGVLQKNLARSTEHLRIWLEDSRDSAELHHPNSWEAAFYRACVASEWFYKGGFSAGSDVHVTSVSIL